MYIRCKRQPIFRGPHYSHSQLTQYIMTLCQILLWVLSLLTHYKFYYPFEDYELVKADQRNIIFVGRSRSGKSTLINVLKNRDFDPEEMQVLRDTKCPC